MIKLRVAWPIREDLVPLFGSVHVNCISSFASANLSHLRRLHVYSPTFPASCLPPDQPGFGQPIENLQKRKHRRAQLPIPSSSSSVNGGRSTPPGQAGPDRVYKPYSPTAASNADSPVYENLGQDQNHFRYGGSGGDITPSSTPGPYYGHPTPSSTYDRSAAEERSRTTSASSNSGRLRYAPYPATSPGQEMVNPSSASYQQHLHQPHNRHRPPSIPILQEPFPASRPAESTQRTDLPSIATFDLGSPGPSATAFALPRIGSIRDMVSRPEMDASTVLRRLKLKDEQDRVSARTGSRGLLQQRQESQQQATGTYPVSRDEAYYQLYRPQSPSPAGDDGSRPSPLYSHQGSPPARRRGSPTTTFGDAPPPGDVAAKGWPGAAVPLYYPGSPAVGRGGSGTSQHPLRPW